MGDLEVAGIATSGRNHIRVRMMHYAFDDDFKVVTGNEPHSIEIFAREVFALALGV